MKKAVMLAVAGSCVFAGLAHAAFGRWPLHATPSATPSLGYDAGSDQVTSIALDPNRPAVLRAGTRNGVYTSIDGGAHWVRTSEGIYGCAIPGCVGRAQAARIDAVLVHPHDSETLWAADSAAGVFRSVDGGVRWTRTGLTASFSTSPASSPRPDVLAFDAARGVLLAANTDGVFRSSDGGETWTGGSPGPGYGPSGESLAVHPQVPGLVFVTTGRGVLRSTDGGATWQPTGYAAGTPRPVFVTVGSGRWVYAGSEFSIHRSADLGDTWEPVTENVGGWGVLDGAAGLVVWGAWRPGILRRGPLDSEFVASTNGLGIAPVNAVVQDASGTLYAAQLGGGGARSDDGATWTPLGGVVRSASEFFIRVAPDATSTLYVGRHRTTDGGATWSPTAIQPPGLDVCPVQDMAFVRSDPGIVYAVTTGAPGVPLCLGAVVRRSTDSGATWRATALSVPEGTAIWRIAVDPADPATVHAVSSETPAARRWAIRTSTDSGDSWSGERFVPDARRARRIDDLVAVPGMPGRLLAATDRGVFVSGDAGVSWHRSRLRKGTTGFAVSRSVPPIVYAEIDFAVFRSSDGGERWERRSDGDEGYLLQLEPGGDSPDVLWAVGSRGLVRSTDGGRRWIRINTNGFPPAAVGPDAARSDRAWVPVDDAGLLEIAIAPCTDASDCDDGEACTTDACRPQAYGADARGCTYDVACTLSCAEDHDCDDGIRCTTERCYAGTCGNAPVDLNEVGCVVSYTRLAMLCAPDVPSPAIARAIDRELRTAAHFIARIGPAGSYGRKDRWIRRTEAALARVVRLGPKTGPCAAKVAEIMTPLHAAVSALRAVGD